MPKREIIQVHVGQAGIQLGNACWELYCLEHGLQPDGMVFQGLLQNAMDEGYNSFFTIDAIEKATPRALFVDLEPTYINEMKVGKYRDLFDHKLLLNGKEDAANNFARGYYAMGMEMLQLFLDRLRYVVEECSNLEGFLIFRSFGGGTGSGLASLILDNLDQEYSKGVILDFAIYPAPEISPVILEPYNTVLSIHSASEIVNCCFMLDNSSCYSILERWLELSRPSYINLNRIMAQLISSVTTSLRFEGSINVNLAEFHANLVPFERIHYPLIAYAPFIPVGKEDKSQYSVAQLTSCCFTSPNQIVACDTSKGKYVSCCLLYRGNVVPTDVNNAIKSIRKRRAPNFVDWCPTGFKVGINYQSPSCVPGGDTERTNRAVTMISNNSAIREAFARVIDKYRVMFQKKVFLHHYLYEGMEVEDFQDAEENISTLVKDYNEIDRG